MKKHILILFAFFVLHGCKTKKAPLLTNKGETTPTLQNTTNDSIKMLSYEEKILKIKHYYQLLQGDWISNDDNMAYSEKTILKIRKNKAYFYYYNNTLISKDSFTLETISCDSSIYVKNPNDVFWNIKTKFSEDTDSLSSCYVIEVYDDIIEIINFKGVSTYQRQ